MTRLMYGGGITDVYVAPDDEGDLKPIGGATVLFYTAYAGGTQLTDLLDVNNQPVTYVTTSTGADGHAAGQIPVFYGPNGVFEMWASAAGSPRVLMGPTNLGSVIGPVKDQFDAHVAARNPHNTRLQDLPDVDGAALVAATTGQVISKASSGLWVATTPSAGGGGTGGVTLDTDQTITAQKTINTGVVSKTALILQAAATGQTADLLVAYSGTDTGAGGARQRTMYLNEKGELRAIAAAANSVAFRLKGQPSQTANVFEVTDTGNNPKAWVASNYAFYAPNSGRSVLFAKAGNLVVGIGTFAFYNDTGVPLTLRSVRASVGTAPAGQSVIVDVNVNGSTVFGTQANRPTIAVGALTNKSTGMSVTVVPDGASVTVDIDQIGTTAPSADLVVQVELW